MGFALNKMAGLPFEASWEGTGLLESIPLIYLQPFYVAIHFFIPVYLLVSLASLFFKANRGHLGWIGFNLLILALTGTLGLNLMHLHRIPSVLTLVLEEPLQLGSVETKKDGVIVGLKTTNFDKMKGRDNVERYRFNLRSDSQKKGSHKKEGSKALSTKFYLSAFTLNGFPVLFLTKADLVLTANGEKVSKWSIKPVLPSQRKTKKGKTQKSPHYVIVVDLPPSRPTFDIKLPKEGPTFSSTDSLHFTLKKASPPIKSFEILVDGVSEIQQNVLKSQRSYTFRLARLSPGKHKVEIKLTGRDGGVSQKVQEITLLPSPGIQVFSPMEGDSFLNSLSVFAKIPQAWRKSLTRVAFYLNDQELGFKYEPPYTLTFDTGDFPVGNYELKITAELKDEAPVTKTIKVVKGPYVRLAFKSPTLGEFVESETDVHVIVDGQNPYKQIALYLKDEKINEWLNANESTSSTFTYTWNNSDLDPGSYVLLVKGMGQDNQQASSWVQVFSGEGAIKVKPPTGKKLKKGALQYQKIVFILDASISQWDGWDGKTKWEWENSLFGKYQVQDKLNGATVGVILSGGKYPYFEKNCSDVQWLVKESKFNHREIINALRKKKPKGVSALFKALEEGLKMEPQKIIVLTDGADSCRKKIPLSLTKALKNSPQTSIDIIALGDLTGSETSLLRKLAKSTAGGFVAVSDGKMLIDEVVSRLTLYYNIMLKDKVIASGPIDGKLRRLRPGKYQLLMDIKPPFKGKSIIVKNGLVTELKLVVGKESTEAKESYRLMK